MFGARRSSTSARSRRAPLPERKPQDEPPQLGVKRVTVKAPAELPYVLMAFRAPALRDAESDWEPYALEMLAAVLDGNEAARLNRTLVREERIASSADASYDGIARGPGFFYLSATPTPGKSAAEVEQALRREMAQDHRRGRHRRGTRPRQGAGGRRAGLPARLDVLPGAPDRRAGSCGLSHRTLDLQLKKLREVTPEQVQEVARKYFRDDALTIATLDPQPLEGARPAAPPRGATCSIGWACRNPARCQPGCDARVWRNFGTFDASASQTMIYRPGLRHQR